MLAAAVFGQFHSMFLNWIKKRISIFGVNAYKWASLSDNQPKLPATRENEVLKSFARFFRNLSIFYAKSVRCEFRWKKTWRQRRFCQKSVIFMAILFSDFNNVCICMDSWPHWRIYLYCNKTSWKTSQRLKTSFKEKFSSKRFFIKLYYMDCLEITTVSAVYIYIYRYMYT